MKIRITSVSIYVTVYEVLLVFIPSEDYYILYTFDKI